MAQLVGLAFCRHVFNFCPGSYCVKSLGKFLTHCFLSLSSINWYRTGISLELNRHCLCHGLTASAEDYRIRDQHCCMRFLAYVLLVFSVYYRPLTVLRYSSIKTASSSATTNITVRPAEDAVWCWSWSRHVSQATESTD